MPKLKLLLLAITPVVSCNDNRDCDDDGDGVRLWAYLEKEAGLALHNTRKAHLEDRHESSWDQAAEAWCKRLMIAS